MVWAVWWVFEMTAKKFSDALPFGGLWYLKVAG